jgi:hypothetical protein
MKPVQRWDAPRGTTLEENNESGELVMFDDHQIVVDAAEAERDRYREALESILEMANEDSRVRTDTSRVYEIRTYARLALNP